MDAVLLATLREDVQEALPGAGPEPSWSILSLLNPKAPILTISRDSRAGPLMVPVFFVAAGSAEDLLSVMKGLHQGTKGLAPLAHQVKGPRLGYFLVIPALYHMFDVKEFVRTVRAYLDGRAEQLAWFSENCEIGITQDGKSHHAVPGPDGTLCVLSKNVSDVLEEGPGLGMDKAANTGLEVTSPISDQERTPLASDRPQRDGLPAAAKDPGLELVDHLFSGMRIDEEWAVRHSRGFTWWAGPLAQHIWADPPVEDFGEQISRVHAQTEVLTNLKSNEATHSILMAMAGFATMSGPLLAGGKLRSAASVYVHEGTLKMWEHLFEIAALLQVASAHIEAETMAEATGAQVAASAHPKSGFRVVPDDMLDVITNQMRPYGEQPSLFIGDDFNQADRKIGRQAIAYEC